MSLLGVPELSFIGVLVVGLVVLTVRAFRR